MRWLSIAVAFAGVVSLDNGHPFWGVLLAIGAAVYAIMLWEKQDSEL